MVRGWPVYSLASPGEAGRTAATAVKIINKPLKMTGWNKRRDIIRRVDLSIRDISVLQLSGLPLSKMLEQSGDVAIFNIT